MTHLHSSRSNRAPSFRERFAQMSGVDSFAIELPPVPLQSFDADSGLMPLFDEPILGGFAVPSYAASSVDSIHSSPVGYSPTHAMPSPQTADGMPGMTESSSDELAHARSGIIDKLPTKKRMGTTSSSKSLAR